jgi:hypothetical protein
MFYPREGTQLGGLMSHSVGIFLSRVGLMSRTFYSLRGTTVQWFDSVIDEDIYKNEVDWMNERTRGAEVEVGGRKSRVLRVGWFGQGTVCGN